MKILITGAAGFIGRHLTKALLSRGFLQGSTRESSANQLILADRIAVDPPIDGNVRMAVGDYSDPAFLAGLFETSIDGVFHLAATLTVEAEDHFEQGMAVNVHGSMRLLEACRKQAVVPRLVFPSSIAAFGGPLPETVDDNVAQTPQTSYGTHKSICELLINDYSRHGFIDGRVLRLPIVIIRPGKPGTAVSDKVASIVREPLMGSDVECPFSPDTEIPVASGRQVAAALLDMYDLAPDTFEHTRSMNMPSLTVSIRDLVNSLNRYKTSRQLGTVSWRSNVELQAVVDGWPSRFVSARASAAGISGDHSIDNIVDSFLEETSP